MTNDMNYPAAFLAWHAEYGRWDLADEFEAWAWPDTTADAPAVPHPERRDAGRALP